MWSSGWCWLLPVTTKHPPQHTILRTNFTLWEKNAAYALSFIQNNQETPPTLVAGIEWIPISISQKQLSVFVSITSSTANSTPGQMQLSGRSAPQTCTPLSFTQNQRSTPEVPASLHFFFFTLKKGDFSARRIEKYSPKTSVCTRGLWAMHHCAIISGYMLTTKIQLGCTRTRETFLGAGVQNSGPGVILWGSPLDHLHRLRTKHFPREITSTENRSSAVPAIRDPWKPSSKLCLEEYIHDLL